MVGPAQSSESQTGPLNLSPSSSSSSSSYSASSRTPKAVIDALCSHIGDTTLTADNFQNNPDPFMQGQNVASPLQVRPFPARRPPLSPAAVPDVDDPMELCENDGVVWGLPSQKEEEEGEECKTPRGEEHRIPEPVTCPPAPKRSRRRWSGKLPSCGGKDEVEEGEGSVDSTDLEEALKAMH